MFVEYLLIITKKWKQIKCHSAGVFNLKKKKKKQRLWYAYAIKPKQKQKQKRLIKVTKQISLNCIMIADSN